MAFYYLAGLLIITCFFAVGSLERVTECVGGGPTVRLVICETCFLAPVFDLHAHAIIQKF